MTINELNAALDIKERREKLSPALKLQLQIDSYYDELKDVRAGNVRGSAATSMPKGGVALSAGDKIAEIEAEIERLEAEKKIEAEIIRRKILSFDLDEREEKLLMLRYVRCLPWCEVYPRIGLKKSWTHEVERNILAKISL